MKQQKRNAGLLLFMKYMLTRLVAASMLDSILALNFDKCLRSDAFMDAIAERINNNRQFMEPIKTPVMKLAVVLAENEMPSINNDRRGSISPPLRSSSASGSDSSDTEGRAGRFRHKLETKRGGRGRSRGQIGSEDINGKRSKNMSEFSQSSEDENRRMSDMSSTDASISSEDNRNHRKMKTREEEEKLRVIRPVNHRFKIAIGYRTY